MQTNNKNKKANYLISFHSYKVSYGSLLFEIAHLKEKRTL